MNSALETLEAKGVTRENIVLLKVPGAFEIPLACKALLETKGCDGVVALGAVIRGETPHFDIVANQCAAGVQNVILSSGKPVAFGVLTTDTVEQALNRAGLKLGNKGGESADALIAQLEALSTI